MTKARVARIDAIGGMGGRERHKLRPRSPTPTAKSVSIVHDGGRVSCGPNCDGSQNGVKFRQAAGAGRRGGAANILRRPPWRAMQRLVGVGAGLTCG